MTDKPSEWAPESKEATHRRFYDAFHAWFMQNNCDFWSECDAPEELATIAVEICDAFVVLALGAARRQALIEASRVAEEIIVSEISSGWRGIPQRIRALADKEPSESPPKISLLQNLSTPDTPKNLNNINAHENVIDIYEQIRNILRVIANLRA